MYGASIFRKINKNDVCVKAQIRQTAHERFNSNPVVFSPYEIISINMNWNDVIKAIRLKMHTHGVKSKNKQNINTLEQVQDLLGSSELASEFESEFESESESKKKIREPRVSYILEPSKSDWNTATRVIALAYSYDEKQIWYGASIFRRTFLNEICIKSDIRYTALERFFQSPIYIDYNNEISVNQVQRIIRTMMYKHGVKSKNSEISNNLYQKLKKEPNIQNIWKFLKK